MEEFEDAIEQELNVLFERGTFKKVRKEDMERHAVKIFSKLVVSIKDVGTVQERNMARLVALGHLDKLKDYIINEAPTLTRYALKIILSLASMFDLKMYF